MAWLDWILDLVGLRPAKRKNDSRACMVSGIIYWRGANEEKRAVIVFNQKDKLTAKNKLVGRAQELGMSKGRRTFRFFSDDRALHLEKGVW